MKKTILAFAVFAALGIAAGTASAAPVTGLIPGATGTGLQQNVLPIHGRHRVCRLGAAGWHWHGRFGRRHPCRPARPRGSYF